MTISVCAIQVCLLILPLSKRAKTLVKEGDRVVEDEILAEDSGELKSFDLAKILGVAPRHTSRYLLNSPAAAIKEGQVVAHKKTLLSQSVFRSPVAGIFESLDDQGVLKIKVGEKKPIKAPVAGRVKKINAEDLSLEYQAMVLTGKSGFGESRWGQLEILEVADLPEVTEDKILILAGKIPTIFVYKAEALEVAGIVGGELNGEVKTQELVLLLAGGTNGLIPEEILETLKKYQGKKALIAGEEKTLKIPL